MRTGLPPGAKKKRIDMEPAILLLAWIMAGEGGFIYNYSEASLDIAWVVFNRMNDSRWDKSYSVAIQGFFGRAEPTARRVRLAEFAWRYRHLNRHSFYWVLSRQDIEKLGCKQGDKVFGKPADVLQLHFYEEEPRCLVR